MVQRVVEISGRLGDGREVALFHQLDSFRFLGARPGRLTVRSCDLGAAAFGVVESTGHEIGLVDPGRATFLAPLRGSLALSAGATELAAGPAEGLLLGRGGRLTAVRPDARGGFRGLVALAPDSACDSAGLLRAQAPTDRVPALRALRAYLEFLAGEGLRPDSPLIHGAAQGAAGAVILDLFAAVDLALRPARSRAAAPGAQRVRQAEELMRARLEEPLTVAEVARGVGLGARSLQLAFQLHRGCAPRAVLTRFRLDRARHLLAAPAPDASVTQVALRCGFTHFGRFAAAYRARFGEPPGATLRRGSG
jgi:AraC-like DNA-binding protein